MIPALSPITLRAMRSTPLGHLERGAPKENVINRIRRRSVIPLKNQMADTMGEGVGLSGTRSCNHQQRWCR